VDAACSQHLRAVAFSFITLTVAVIFPSYYLRHPHATRHKGYVLVGAHPDPLADLAIRPDADALALAVYVSVARAVQDVVVASCIGYRLLALDKGLAKVNRSHILRSLAWQLALSFELSFITAMWSVTTVATYLASREGNLHTIFVFGAGSVHFLSMVSPAKRGDSLRSHADGAPDHLSHLAQVRCAAPWQ
jgi:hypothetical protein